MVIPPRISKKAQMHGLLITVIVIVIVSFIVFGLAKSLVLTYNSIGEGYFPCLFRKIVSAYTKTPLLHTQTWSSFCPPVIRRVELEWKDGTKRSSDTAYLNIELPKGKVDGKLDKWYKGAKECSSVDSWYQDKNNLCLRKYHLQEEVAQAMKRCWGRNGEGRLPLGKEWRERKLSNLWYIAAPIFYCDLCYIISFDEGTKQSFPQKVNMDDFLQRNPISSISFTSYWEFLKDDSTPSDFFKSWDFSTQEKLAVVYIRANPTQLSNLIIKPFKSAANLPKDEPYDDILLTTLEEYRNRCLKAP
ncbi:hypothetical protein HYU14_01055 [Candidatus Woesearchaeota archaeon]|nr:hypothetical protein [Candidatus Woesearchaeota archaeon]